jgi:hypothetical protein
LAAFPSPIPQKLVRALGFSPSSVIIMASQLLQAWEALQAATSLRILAKEVSSYPAPMARMASLAIKRPKFAWLKPLRTRISPGLPSASIAQRAAVMVELDSRTSSLYDFMGFIEAWERDCYQAWNRMLWVFLKSKIIFEKSFRQEKNFLKLS